jgi:hypothetical protein
MPKNLTFSRQFAKKFASKTEFCESKEYSHILQYQKHWRSSYDQSKPDVHIIHKEDTIFIDIDFQSQEVMEEWILATKLTRLTHGEFGWHRVGNFDIGYECKSTTLPDILEEYIKNDAIGWNQFKYDRRKKGNDQDISLFIRALNSACDCCYALNPLFNVYDIEKETREKLIVSFDDMPGCLLNMNQFTPTDLNGNVKHNFNVLIGKITGRYLLEKYKDLDVDENWLANYYVQHGETVAKSFRNNFLARLHDLDQ